MKEKKLPDLPDAKSPAGADVRLLMSSDTGDMIHSTVPGGQTNRAVVHATVNEFWYILEGHGEIWRRDHEQERVTTLVPGVAIDIPVGTAFQYRNVGTGPLRFICVTMPRWCGNRESTYVEGIWEPSI
jgi:mannose-6-phosphate isomerase-like protein (cupin superfamily)